MKKLITTTAVLAGLFAMPAFHTYRGKPAPPVVPAAADDEDDEDDNDDPEDKKGQSFTAKDLHDAAEKARLEERTKLQGKIASLQAEVGTLKEALKETNTANNTTIQDLTAKLAAIKDAAIDADGKKLDVEKLLSTYAAKARDAVTQEAKESTASLTARLEQLETENRTIRAANLRRELIEAAGGEGAMVVEMVSGETKEAIEASIEIAVAAYERIVSKSGGKKGKPAAKKEGADEDDDSGVPPTLPDAAKGKKKDQQQPSEVKNMSRKTYAEQREKLLADVARKAGQGASPFSR